LAKHIGDRFVALPAKGDEIIEILVSESFIGAVVDFYTFLGAGAAFVPVTLKNQRTPCLPFRRC
jgi:hypothetical protein